MTVLQAVAAVLALGSLAWVLAPLLAPKRRSSAGAPQVACSTCGLRPESDATYCSNCGRSLTSRDR